MSDIEGLYDKSPKEHPDARLIGEVTDIASLRQSVDTGGKSSFGSGGMDSKIDAAEAVREYGTALLLVCGKSQGVLMRIAAGEGAGTIFVPTV
jgi:glutamate 5-kinase